MNKIFNILLIAFVFLTSCNDEEKKGDFYQMFIAIEVADNQGQDLLASPSSIINEGEAKITIAGKDYYLDRPQEKNPYIFRLICGDTKSYLLIGSWHYDCTNEQLIVDWGSGATKDTIIFSYDSPQNGMLSAEYDFRYPYHITINGKVPELNKEEGRYIYVKE